MDTSLNRAFPVISPPWDLDTVMKAFADSWKPRVRICVKGYDTSLTKADIKKALIGHFNSCGEIGNVVFPIDPVTGVLDRSCAFLVISGEGAEEKALALNGSDLGGWNVSVVKAGKKEKTPEEMEALMAVLNDKNRRFGISVKGFDTSLPEDDLKAALRQELASCGEILHIYIPRGDRIAYVYFSGEEAIARALELYGLGRTTMWGGQQAQARAVERAGWNLVAMRIPNNEGGSSGCVGYTIPPHVVEWTNKQRKTTELFGS